MAKEKIIPASGGTFTLSISTTHSWQIVNEGKYSSQITFSKMSGKGSSSIITMTVNSNTSSVQREIIFSVELTDDSCQGTYQDFKLIQQPDIWTASVIPFAVGTTKVKYQTSAYTGNTENNIYIQIPQGYSADMTVSTLFTENVVWDDETHERNISYTQSQRTPIQLFSYQEEDYDASYVALSTIANVVLSGTILTPIGLQYENGMMLTFTPTNNVLDLSNVDITDEVQSNETAYVEIAEILDKGDSIIEYDENTHKFYCVGEGNVEDCQLYYKGHRDSFEEVNGQITFSTCGLDINVSDRAPQNPGDTNTGVVTTGTTGENSAIDEDSKNNQIGDGSNIKLP